MKLHLKHLWKGKLPEPFDSVPESTSSVYISKYNTAYTRSTMYGPALRAIINYAKLQYATETGGTYRGAIGYKDEDILVAEYISKSHTCVVFNKKTHKFIAGKCEDINRKIFSSYSLGENGESGSALFFALMPIFLADSEFGEAYNMFYELMKDNFKNLEETYHTGFMMCDNIYRRIAAGQMIDGGVEVSIPSTGNITPFTANTLIAETYKPTTTLYGKFEVLIPEVDEETSYVPIKHEDFIGKYQLSERTLSDEEKSLIPQLPDWYVIPKEVENICRHIKGSLKSNMPVKNIMLRGPAGTGKTESVKAIAAGLNLPYMFLTCSANSEVFDLVGQILPEMETKSEQDSLPDFDDILMDPGSVYQELTGIYKEDVKKQDVFKLLVEKSRPKDESTQSFRYIETALVKAIRNGYVIEIQEPAIISNPGVLVGLNGLLDKCESITLPTGETIKRHPEAIVVITTNTDYEGCKAMNQSIISRMNMVFDIDELTKAKLVERVSKVTGFEDDNLLNLMAEVMQDISIKCKETMITDGSCGVREFIAWVESAKITKNAYESALYTVIPLATADPESRAELISTCLSTRIQP